MSNMSLYMSPPSVSVSLSPAKGVRTESTAFRDKSHCSFMLHVVHLFLILSLCLSLSAVHAGVSVLVLHLGDELLWLASLQRCL